MLWLAPVGREVVDAAMAMPVGTVGLIPSVSQVGYAGVGYTGLDNRNLMWQVGDRLPVHRDHLGYGKEDVLACMESDLEAGFTSVMLDTDAPEPYQWLIGKPMQLECGGGEHITDTLALKVRSKLALHCKIQSYSMDFGPLIRGQTNRGVRGTSDLMHVLRTYGPPRVHNCDYLPLDQYTVLAKAGATHFNIAPQLGAIITLTYLRLAREHGVNLDAWCQMVYNSKRWETWTQQPMCAVEAGGHYHLEQLPRDFRKQHYNAAVTKIIKFAKAVLSAIGDKRESDNH